jgi:hypothetical protein
VATRVQLAFFHNSGNLVNRDVSWPKNRVQLENVFEVIVENSALVWRFSSDNHRNAVEFGPVFPETHNSLRHFQLGPQQQGLFLFSRFLGVIICN